MIQAEHGGGLDAAAAVYGGRREDWLDLSTGINPLPYPLPPLAPEVWSRLPDDRAMAALLEAARRIWNVPNTLDIVAAPGTSALIAALPRLGVVGRAEIISPTYNEHQRAFAAQGWQVVPVSSFSGEAAAQVVVSPNNPDGRMAASLGIPPAPLVVIDESFADCLPGAALPLGDLPPGGVVLKGIGKFWGLAGLRLGFAICHPGPAENLRMLLGPWAVSGPALAIGTAALGDRDWQANTRDRLSRDSARLAAMLREAGLEPLGGTPLFRLVASPGAKEVYETLARRHILVRSFAAHPRWLRFGLPGDLPGWERLQEALETCR